MNGGAQRGRGHKASLARVPGLTLIISLVVHGGLVAASLALQPGAQFETRRPPAPRPRLGASPIEVRIVRRTAEPAPPEKAEQEMPPEPPVPARLARQQVVHDPKPLPRPQPRAAPAPLEPEDTHLSQMATPTAVPKPLPQSEPVPALTRSPEAPVARPKPSPSPSSPQSKPEPRPVQVVARPAPSREPLAEPAQPRRQPDRPGKETTDAPPSVPPAAEGVTQGARVATLPTPHYPRSCRRRGIEGRVIIEVLVRPDGRPGRIEITESSGSPQLDEAALSAVRRAQFEPAMRGGRPIETVLVVPIRFQLK